MPDHHAALSIAAYGFLKAERLVAHKPLGGKRNFIEGKVPALSEDCVPRGSPASATPCGDVDHDVASPAQLPADRSSRAVSLLRQILRTSG